MTPTERFVWAVFAHLVADWVLQNDWMARNKHEFGRPASVVHGVIHMTVQIPVFLGIIVLHVPIIPMPVTFPIGILHMFIDTRIPVRLWQRFFRQTTEGPAAMTVAIVVDQVFHLIVLAGAVWLVELL